MGVSNSSIYLLILIRSSIVIVRSDSTKYRHLVSQQFLRVHSHRAKIEAKLFQKDKSICQYMFKAISLLNHFDGYGSNLQSEITFPFAQCDWIIT